MESNRMESNRMESNRRSLAHRSAGVNFTPLTPISFLDRAASVHPQGVSVIYGRRRYTWRLTLQRCKRLATALRLHGVAEGDTVSVIAPNVPEMYEAHFGIPMSGALINTINTRLDDKTVAHVLSHGEAKVLIAHTDCLHVTIRALALLAKERAGGVATLVLISDEGGGAPEQPQQEPNQSTPSLPELSGLPPSIAVVHYETLLLQGDPNPPTECFMPRDENSPIALNYTSGTTALPKGVVFTHRGAFLNALSNNVMAELPSRAVYLWTVPMFHCNGWCFPWGVAALSGTNVCLRALDVGDVFRCIAEHDVTVLCAAPTVLTMMINADDTTKAPLLSRTQGLGFKGSGFRSKEREKVITGGSPPPVAVLGKMEELQFQVIHIYGLTETYGPGTYCEWKGEEWDGMSLPERARLNARQGVRHLGLDRVAVLDPESLTEVPWDGQTMGEVMFRGNTVMKEYLKDPESTERAFKGGWFRSGDLGVVHPDGYIQLKDRSKDIIISGGENISTIQVENVLYLHEEVLEAAVVAMPDDKWGEVPCAFVMLKKDDNSVPCFGFTARPEVEARIREFCRENLPKFMAPARVVFGQLPKTSTGKVQKFKLREVAKHLAGSSGESVLLAALGIRSKL